VKRITWRVKRKTKHEPVTTSDEFNLTGIAGLFRIAYIVLRIAYMVISEWWLDAEAKRKSACGGLDTRYSNVNP